MKKFRRFWNVWNTIVDIYIYNYMISPWFLVNLSNKKTDITYNYDISPGSLQNVSCFMFFSAEKFSARVHPAPSPVSPPNVLPRHAWCSWHWNICRGSLGRRPTAWGAWWPWWPWDGVEIGAMEAPCIDIPFLTSKYGDYTRFSQWIHQQTWGFNGIYLDFTHGFTSQTWGFPMDFPAIVRGPTPPRHMEALEGPCVAFLQPGRGWRAPGEVSWKLSHNLNGKKTTAEFCGKTIKAINRWFSPFTTFFVFLVYICAFLGFVLVFMVWFMLIFVSFILIVLLVSNKLCLHFWFCCIPTVVNSSSPSFVGESAVNLIGDHLPKLEKQKDYVKPPAVHIYIIHVQYNIYVLSHYIYVYIYTHNYTIIHVIGYDYIIYTYIMYISIPIFSFLGPQRGLRKLPPQHVSPGSFLCHIGGPLFQANDHDQAMRHRLCGQGINGLANHLPDVAM